jgi:sterol 3beta-glucosyltransferase
VKIGMVITGSRGDIQPFAALAHGLSVEGHEVAVTANADAAPLINAAGAKFVPMDLDIRQFLSSPAGQNALMQGTAAALLDSGNAWFAENVQTILDGANVVVEGADVVISGLVMDDYAAALCASFGIPLVLAYVHPWEPTASFPHPLMYPDWLGSDQLSEADILRTNRDIEQVHWRSKHASVNAVRTSLNLPHVEHPMFQAAAGQGIPVLNEYSEVVVPRPQDWGRNSVMTGYWQLAEQTRQRLGEETPSAHLLEWLDAGPAPVFLGFGSMPILDPAPMLEMAIKAAHRAGVRILIGAGWTDIAVAAGGLPEDVEIVHEIDHDWLFPRCKGVVHHGGSGTIGTALAAGRPSFVYSIFLDQPFWGSRIAQLGAGGHRRFAELSLDTLTEALELLSREDVAENAAALGRRLRQEDGVANAIRVITDPACTVVPR